ncbi:hypothetical protein ACFP81_04340 [Deinococcus lacus]|uniref:Lipoprotein n=1 Tax=Deinococcus lacus TaxID=392561 RepID=A0ABW1YEK2_9DEIO
MRLLTPVLSLLALTACAPAPALTSREAQAADAALLQAYWGRQQVGAMCSHRVLGRAGDTLYAWAVCENYQRVGAAWQAVAGMSSPVVIRLEPQPSVTFPGDGSRHESDIRRLFPERLHARALRHDAATVRQLQAQNQAKLGITAEPAPK